MKTKSNKGFTLVELLLVIAIIAILATVLFVSLGSQRERARVSAFKENARGLVTTYTACADGQGEIFGTAAGADLDGTGAACTGGTSGIDQNTPKVASCDGVADSYATISTNTADNPNTGDNWSFYAQCTRSTDYCGLKCSADGCEFNVDATGAADATSKCE
jgi:prepilin-type N-terminal cleavage/methylation domain-containing protein